MKTLKFAVLFFLIGFMTLSVAQDATNDELTSALIIDWSGRIHTANEQMFHPDDAVLVIDASYIKQANLPFLNPIAGNYYAFKNTAALSSFDTNEDFTIDEGDAIYSHLSLIYLFGIKGTKIVSLKTAGIRAITLKNYYNPKTQPKEVMTDVIGKAILSTSTTLDIYQLFIKTSYFTKASAK